MRTSLVNIECFAIFSRQPLCVHTHSLLSLVFTVVCVSVIDIECSAIFTWQDSMGVSLVDIVHPAIFSRKLVCVVYAYFAILEVGMCLYYTCVVLSSVDSRVFMSLVDIVYSVVCSRDVFLQKTLCVLLFSVDSKGCMA